MELISPGSTAAPHQLEAEVRSELLSHPELNFSTLVIHRVNQGVCLEGSVEVDDEFPDIVSLLRKVRGVDRVLNRLRVTLRSSASCG